MSRSTQLITDEVYSRAQVMGAYSQGSLPLSIPFWFCHNLYHLVEVVFLQKESPVSRTEEFGYKFAICTQYLWTQRNVVVSLHWFLCISVCVFFITTWVVHSCHKTCEKISFFSMTREIETVLCCCLMVSSGIGDWVVRFDNFYGMNTPRTTAFKLPVA
jgi:hypothetical protein